MLGSSFQNIQGFGDFGEFAPVGDESMLFEPRGFQATAIAIPEPAVAALLLAGRPWYALGVANAAGANVRTGRQMPGD